jgi:proteasomal ATPase-associated factor 1
MTTHSASPLTLPVVTIQNTFQEVIQEVLDGIIPSDKFWVSCYKSSESSVHAKVHAELDEFDRNLVNLSPTEGDVEMVKASNGVSVSYVTFPQAYSIF